ncbi:MAG: TlpA disulfide reductase family protein [Bacteroidia bacterium]|nr:TlpA family protein disulfide reductase [Bacteroidia bacterium]MDW8333874.1 TlpA disulfide reductase family protein [Bacteroidia bacterium]
MSVAAMGVSQAQEVKKIKIGPLLERLGKTEGKTLVVNFWATWCKPCVKELPHFERLNTEYADKNVKVILVSLDFPEDYETKLKAFVKSKALRSELYWLDETNPNDWINRVNPQWQGAIPATLIVAKDGRFADFHSGEFDYESLTAFVEKSR